jgi:prepilin peptidase CpaA
LALAVILAIAATTDLAQRKVYNWLTLPGMILGLGLNGWFYGWPGLGAAGLGLAAGGLIFSPFFYFGGMGAGDVKLMAVVGACLGWVFVINAAIYTALVGGLAAIVFLLLQGKLVNTLLHLGRVLTSIFKPRGNLEPLSRSDPLPYAVFIALGAVLAYFLPPFLNA